MGNPRAAAYIFASCMLALTQGIAMNMVTVNLPQIQGQLDLSANEASWLAAAYMAPNVSLALAMLKVRDVIGLRRFAEISISIFICVSLTNLWITSLESALVTRFFSGMAAAPLTSLAMLYMMEAFPQDKKVRLAPPLSLLNTTLGAPVARLISPSVLDAGGIYGIVLIDLGMGLIAGGLVLVLPLAKQAPRTTPIVSMDVLVYLTLAFGLGSIAVVLVLGRPYWWFQAPWLGVTLATGLALLAVAALLELNRKVPMFDLGWIFSPAILRFAAIMLIFRMVVSEQFTGTTMLQALGLQNEQLAGLSWMILLSSIAGGLCCAFVMKPGDLARSSQIHLVALALLAAGAWLDSFSTSQTRPQDMMLSQGMIAFATTMFLPPAMVAGLMAALKHGSNYILSFVVVFMTTQSLGSLLGSALMGTYVTIREKLHSSYLVEHVTLSDPQVVNEIALLSGAYAKTLNDPVLLQAEGIAVLGRNATREANILAYNDAFTLIAALAAFAFTLLLVQTLWKAARARLAAPSKPASADVS
ncbi:MFS transporter [Paracoccus cavernae]|uniref:MFS transporter n=2 Tax=Paracoccus cavernae TaxID=1571207 RepID=UPI0035F490CA